MGSFLLSGLAVLLSMSLGAGFISFEIFKNKPSNPLAIAGRATYSALGKGVCKIGLEAKELNHKQYDECLAAIDGDVADFKCSGFARLTGIYDVTPEEYNRCMEEISSDTNTIREFVSDPSKLGYFNSYTDSLKGQYSHAYHKYQQNKHQSQNKN